MLYAVANDRWMPGLPLAAAETMTGLYRTRREADEVAAGRRLLAISVRYDSTRGLITPTPPTGFELPGGWSAPAIVGPAGAVTALATIPAALVRELGPARFRSDPGHRPVAYPHLYTQQEAVGSRSRR